MELPILAFNRVSRFINVFLEVGSFTAFIWVLNLYRLNLNKQIIKLKSMVLNYEKQLHYIKNIVELNQERTNVKIKDNFKDMIIFIRNQRFMKLADTVSLIEFYNESLNKSLDDEIELITTDIDKINKDIYKINKDIDKNTTDKIKET